MKADLWRCQECARTYVVPSLARDCEAKHEEALYELERVRDFPVGRARGAA